MKLIQCVVARDHEGIDMVLASGVDPLCYFERVVRLRYDAVETLMQHVTVDHYPIVLSLAKHLWALNNYPEAHISLRNWLVKIRGIHRASHASGKLQ